MFQVEVTDAALLALIENYCREAGVRNLQKQIEKIYRKVLLVIYIYFSVLIRVSIWLIIVRCLLTNDTLCHVYELCESMFLIQFYSLFSVQIALQLVREGGNVEPAIVETADQVSEDKTESVSLSNESVVEAKESENAAEAEIVDPATNQVQTCKSNVVLERCVKYDMLGYSNF